MSVRLVRDVLCRSVRQGLPLGQPEKLTCQGKLKIIRIWRCFLLTCMEKIPEFIRSLWTPKAWRKGWASLTCESAGTKERAVFKMQVYVWRLVPATQ